MTYEGTEKVNFGAGVAMALIDQPWTTILAVGAPSVDGSTNGTIEVYHYASVDDNPFEYSWKPLGAPIRGPTSTFGNVVAMSSDGNIIVSAGVWGDQNSCIIRAYKYNSSNMSWPQVGQDIKANEGEILKCESVALSGDGKSLVIGPALSNRKGKVIFGRVRAYTFSKASSWMQKGQDLETIYPPSGLSTFGSSLSISHDGNRIVAGVMQGRGDTLDSAEYALTFDFDRSSKKWSLLGGALVGEAGSSGAMAMSDDGQTLVVGSYGGSSYRGAVQAYKYVNW